jgi:hypothetical protein
MKILSALTLLLFVACARAPGMETAGEKAFDVPTALADKFTVKDVGAKKEEPKAAEKVAEAPAPKAKGKKRVKGKGKKAAKAEETKPAPEAFPNRWTMPPLFPVGEKYKFDITYFGATAGTLDLETLPNKVVNDRAAFHFRAVAQTASVFSLFYRLNDVVESFMDTEALFSHKFSIKLDESLQTRDLLELYDQRAHKAYYWSKLDHKKSGKKEEKFEIDLEPFTQDGLSSFYYVRTLPLEMGKPYEFPTVNNGKLRRVRVTAVRKESLKTKLGTFDTIVVKPEVVLDGALKSYGDSFMWISDDPRRILLKIDAKIKVGSVIAYLKEHSFDGKPTEGR